MKRKAKIKEEMDECWEAYNSNIDKFVESDCKDFDYLGKSHRIYGRIEALTWVLENTDENLREL